MRMDSGMWDKLITAMDIDNRLWISCAHRNLRRSSAYPLLPSPPTPDAMTTIPIARELVNIHDLPVRGVSLLAHGAPCPAISTAKVLTYSHARTPKQGHHRLSNDEGMTRRRSVLGAGRGWIVVDVLSGLTV